MPVPHARFWLWLAGVDASAAAGNATSTTSTINALRFLTFALLSRAGRGGSLVHEPRAHQAG